MRNLLSLACLLCLPLLAGCGDEELGECPDDATPTQQEQGKGVIEAKCNSCHGSSKTGDARQGAPTNLKYDDPAVVKANREEMWEQTQSGSMPPTGGAVTGGDLDAVRAYLACLP